jgi:hypothetical protein
LGCPPRSRPWRRCALSDEHFTNVFLEETSRRSAILSGRRTGNRPRSGCRSTGVDPRHQGLANHVAPGTPDRGFDPAFSHKLEPYHEIMTVYYAAAPPVESSSAAAEVDCNPRPEESLA